MARTITVGVFLVLCAAAVRSQLVCYQCDDCELQQEIPVVCGDIYFPTASPTPTDTTCPTCAPEPTPPTTPEWTTSTPDTTCPTCAPTIPTTPIPTTSTPEETTCPTCAPTLPTSPYPTTSTPVATSIPDTTCPTCAPTLPTSPYPTTSTPFPSSTTLPTTPQLTTSTPVPTTPTPVPTPSCPAGCCPCSGSRSTSVFAMAARATKQALMDEFEEDVRSARQLPLPVYVCFTTERYVNNRRVVSRGCTKRQQSLSDTCTLLAGGQVYEQCSLCSWQLCNR
uniref:Uncharacterized protein n=1 Tax=Anopheles dirus TaxID=7168 RepID=A0A182NB35_9DIPT